MKIKNRQKNPERRQMTAGILLTFLLFAITLTIVFSVPAAAWAAGSGITGTITVELKGNGRPVPGATLSAVKVADGAITNNGKSVSLAFTDAFKKGSGFSTLKSKVDISDTGNLTQKDAAKIIFDFQKKNNIGARSTRTADQNGHCIFRGLDPGLYLIVQRDRLSGYTAVTPFLVMLPEQGTDGTLNYDVKAEPKIEKDNVAFGDPGVIKVIKGNPDGITTFRFRLKPEKDTNPMPSRNEVIINNEGALEFGQIRFDTPGTYRYRVTEAPGNAMGFTYDRSVYEIKYEVKNGDPWTSTRTTTNLATGEVKKDSETAIFTNIYKPTIIPPGTAVPSVTKRIIGDKPKTAENFQFTLKADASGNPMPSGSRSGKKRITVTGQGRVAFGKITFKKSGTYTYTVREEKGKNPHYTYDGAVYRIVYKVTRDKNSKKLKVAKNVYSGKKSGKRMQKNSDSPLFKNKYKKNTPHKTNTTTKKTRKKLPQTGQLWWPVGILAATGICLLSAGLIRRKRS